ncbi:MAG: hypothetical protein QXO21_03050 [Candidatus Anstonellales archaeon]
MQTNTVISKLNYHHLKELIIFFKKLGVKNIELDFPRPLGNAWKYFSQVMPTKTEVIPFLQSVARKTIVVPIFILSLSIFQSSYFSSHFSV